MVAPAFILMCLLLLGPLLGVIALSFTDYQLGSPQFSWIGLANYQDMLADRVFWISLRNTLTYVAIVVPAAVALGLGRGAADRKRRLACGPGIAPSISCRSWRR